MNKVRVRYAPSPTGYLHIGGARSALFNYLFAKKNNGDFVLRIEDTDIERNIPGAEESQIKDLEWLGIIADESINKPNPKYAPYRQTEKLDLYRKYAQILIDKGLAYECYCTEEELEKMKEEQLSRGVKSFKYDRHCLNLTEEEKAKYKAEGRKPSIRLKLPANEDLSFNDLVRGPIKFNSNDFGDFVIIKSNGIPTYNFAVVIDDHLMEISHVLRGEEHLSNTPKQLQIYKYFGWEPPKFGHMTIIVNEKGRKLSKRDGSIVQFISQYRELGYLPEAICNFLFLLGFTPKEANREIFSLDEQIKEFDLVNLSKSPSMFDNSKLKWMNGQYIKKIDNNRYLDLVGKYLDKIDYLKDYSKERKEEIALIFKNEITCGSDIINEINAIFDDTLAFNDEELSLLSNSKSTLSVNTFAKNLETISDVNKETINNLLKESQKEIGIKGKDFYMPIRVLLTHKTHGIEMYNIIDILGKEETIKRLSKTND
ncbi:MAG: glutamate--tRNA ligase [Firmicutes bacterium]|uniref:Glutamate--tRNA ligase n=1 Tax=Candidatus Onthovivens merdipullorum TaxID=2840889 RepID=A0A9D9GXD8_9BACL|nr:glutamate--tRNA ligase [Candidatus Onthovivens merdipullorum]